MNIFLNEYFGFNEKMNFQKRSSTPSWRPITRNLADIRLYLKFGAQFAKSSAQKMSLKDQRSKNQGTKGKEDECKRIEVQVQEKFGQSQKDQ